MKLSDSDRLELLGKIVGALIPLQITRTSPAKDGTRKPASWDFATACWANRFLDSIEYVLEKEEEKAAKDKTYVPTSDAGAAGPF